MNLLTPTLIRDLARRHEVHPSKALGQNFVIDANTIRKLVRLVDLSPSDCVIEVGPGFGSLTLALAAECERLVAVEFDRRLVAALDETLRDIPNVEVIHADAMDFDYSKVIGDNEFRFVSNLPYNIATPLIADLLSEQPSISDFTVMVQREVGERLVSMPGSKTYGAVSVLVSYHCRSKILTRISRTAFWPVPSVDSVVVYLERRPPVVDVEEGKLMAVVRKAFSQRRKTLRNSLEIEDSVFASAGLSPGARPEELSLEDFARLAQAVG